MNAARLGKYAGTLVTLALCAGCSAGAPSPSSAGLNFSYVGKTLYLNGRPVTAARPNLRPPLRYAVSVPGRHPRSRFEYVINFYGSYASIFDYPKSHHQIGTINNVGGQGCTNVLYGYGKTTFWIVAAFNQIEEFKVPKTPIKSLSDSVGMPSSCAMNSSGDLAVGILDGSGGGDIVIYKHASGSGTVYTTPLTGEYFDGYDNHGNLFADGFSNSAFMLIELPKGGSKFQTVTTSNSVGFPGSVQWDGKYLTVLDQAGNNIYQYVVTGTKATLKGTVSLAGAGDCAQTWIVTHLVYCGDASLSGGEVFRYPAGGSAIVNFTGTFDFPLGVVAARK